MLLALEPHTAADCEITVVIRKRERALVVLREHLKTGMVVARWLWVTHGRVQFSVMDKARRRLDQHGIEFVGKQVKDLSVSR